MVFILIMISPEWFVLNSTYLVVFIKVVSFLVIASDYMHNFVFFYKIFLKS